MSKNAEYQPPMIEEIGTLHEITLLDKNLGAADGITFQGTPIGVVSS